MGDSEASAQPTMLILRGKDGTYSGKEWPRGALDEPAALEYAKKRGYVGKVLDVAGRTGPKSEQTLMALAEFRRDDSVAALYGFSGGGFNVHWVLQALSASEKKRIKLVVVLGAADHGNSPDNYRGHWELVWRDNPDSDHGGHMGGPRMLLQSLKPKPKHHSAAVH